MIILIKLFLNSKLDLIRTVKFVKQLFRIQIQKGGKVLLWSQVKSRIEARYSELILFRALNGFQVMINKQLGDGVAGGVHPKLDRFISQVSLHKQNLSKIFHSWVTMWYPQNNLHLDHLDLKHVPKSTSQIFGK